MFQCFRKLLEINLTDAYSLVNQRAHNDTLTRTIVVKGCSSDNSQNPCDYEIPLNRIE